MPSKHTPLSYIEISKANLVHNIKEFRKLINPKTKIMAVVKANAYGHGQNEVVKILDPYVDYFFVDDIEELEKLREVSKKKTFVLGYVGRDELYRAIKLSCTLSVFGIEQLQVIAVLAKRAHKVQEVHLSVDAYLGRDGILPRELGTVLKEFKKYKNLKLTGIYAHFANIEDTNNFTHARKQIDLYQRILHEAENFGFKNLETHISATSGLLVYEKNAGINSIIRLGIGLYGLWPSEHIKFLYRNKLELKSVLSWKAKVAQVKILPAGYTVGYGLTHMTYKSTKIALVPQGYSDGLDRGLSNKGYMLIGGSRAKILGRISMNMCVVDVTQISKVKIEDPVVIIGSQGKSQITAEEVANHIDTINYEIVARVSPLLPRIVI